MENNNIKNLSTYDNYKISKIIFDTNHPTHWKIKQVKNSVIKKITDGPHVTPKMTDKGIPFLSVNNIQDNKIVFNDKAIVYHLHPKTLSKYLKTKFFRAYYRPKMYAEHKEKMLNDSYTPQALKFQIILFYLIILSSVMSIFNVIFAMFSGLFLITHIVLGAKLFNLAWKKDKLVAFTSIPLLLLRSVVFGTGLIAGIIKK